MSEISLSTASVAAMKRAGITFERLIALHRIGRMDFLRSDIVMLQPREVQEISDILDAAYPNHSFNSWVFRLTLKAYLGDYDLSALTYSTSTSKALLDLACECTPGTVDQVNYLLSRLPRKKRKVLIASFRFHQQFTDIAKQFECSPSYIRQLYHGALKDINDGFMDELLDAVFIVPDEMTEEEKNAAGIIKKERSTADIVASAS